MFLKKMSLYGFKSFAYPIDINFTNGLTVIVGPNGSGKSNINDALKWVLGEASKKNLRASSAKDMIFAGSSDEKPSDFAKVTLFLDNSKKILNSKFKEVSITRKSFLNKDENEYYINDELVRRKDIKDLFLDTGLGNVDLSIISQGSITKMVEAKPKDLREILNEAAGVSRYQKQKNEALNNLFSVEKNLEILSIKNEEFEKRIKPLKKQAEKAKEFNNIWTQLKKIELPIIKTELKNSTSKLEKLNQDFEKTNFENQNSNQQIESISKTLKENKSEVIKINQDISKIEIKIKNLNNQIENQKLNAKTDLEKLVMQIKEDKSAIIFSKKTLQENKLKLNDILQKTSNLKDKLDLLNHLQEKLNKEILNIKFQIDNLTNKTKNSKLDFGTENIVNNKAIFKEYVGLVRDLYKTDEKYSIAIEKSLGGSLTNIVMSNEEQIKQALDFLKKNNYGSATFIPFKQVKPKLITEELENILSNVRGYLGTLSELITYKKEFENLFKFLGGLILIFDNFENALKAAKLINYRFKIVTLEGDIILPGFVVKGGSNNSKNNYLKNQIEKLNILLNEKTIKLKENSIEITNLNKDLINYQKDNEYLNYELVRINERIDHKEAQLNNSLHLYKDVSGNEYYDDSSISNSKQEEKTFESLENLQLNLKKLSSKREILLKSEIELNDKLEKLRKTWSFSVEQKANLKEQINKNTKIISDNLIILQKDYKINEEIFVSMEIPKLSISIENAQIKRKELREKIEKIGYVNLETIKEYETLNQEYEDLVLKLNELKSSKDKLLSTVEDMDNKMKEKFSKTFNEVNEQFHLAFEKLFDGGTARIKYEDPENILESGIEIFARSPGKNVKNIQLYSGGEKSMIAIALIFAINKVRRLPLLILDEVEAALDEANVERFAWFAKEINKTTQVIITSHRPGTMEKADILYGVTMEKPGITKILTVKLEQAIELAD